MEEKIILWLQSHSHKFLDVFMQGESYLASWIGAVCMFLIIIFFVRGAWQDARWHHEP